MSLDLTAELVAALRSDAGRLALAEAIKPALVTVVREELERASDALLTDRDAATYLGLSPAAFWARIRREPELAKLAQGGNRWRRWRRTDLSGYMAARATSRTTRAA